MALAKSGPLIWSDDDLMTYADQFGAQSALRLLLEYREGAETRKVTLAHLQLRINLKHYRSAEKELVRGMFAEQRQAVGEEMLWHLLQQEGVDHKTAAKLADFKPQLQSV